MSSARHYLTAGFYWIGVITALACLATAFAGNTDLLYRLEHMPFPLSCTLGLIAILAFLAAEICHPVRELPIEESEAEDTSAELYPAWETAEV